LSEVIEYLKPRCLKLAEALAKVPKLELEELRTSGYVVDTVQAAFWALHHAHSLPEGLVRVSNLGEDTDTAGANAGILLGAKVGSRGIPEDWLKGLEKKSELRSLAAALVDLAEAGSGSSS
jgi:ADP-ribosylglycohydrolase